jgi:tetratricopeptide (TPR) repeat protein
LDVLDSALRLRSERGLLARVLDERDVAIPHYSVAAELSPKDAELRFNLGEALHQAGRVDDAIDSYREALELDAKLNVARVIGPVTHFTVTVKPVADGVPVALQHLVGKRWKTVEKGLTSDGEFTWTVGVPPDTTSKWRAFVRGSANYGESTSKAVRVVGP